ncbi:hypothetical protein CY0110_17162 [Crocosphaera chwakensis CCY0110]|uniref:Uncharacterized protein n=1 Tax=Crocosphaera chwakensis CCY0110 TaxID=391612 RepID=A3IIB4_9CHRO|nr:hypothetical protein CY0110_17162 [Crocosphaera chwakensis CCY0110]
MLGPHYLVDRKLKSFCPLILVQTNK